MTREEAIKILKEIEYPVNGDNKEYRDMAFNMAIEALKEQRPHGVWKEVSLTFEEKCFFGELWECSACGVKDKKTNFCPNCGSDNRPKEGDLDDGETSENSK